MANNNHPPYFRNVSEEDYAFLKVREPHIIEEIQKKLYEEGIAPSKKQLPSFAYNPTRQVLAIYFKEGKRDKKENRRLILSKLDILLMDEVEKRTFLAARAVLDESLEGKKLKEENWE